MKITIELTKEQVEIFEDAVYFYCDKGPCGEGWKSDRLIEVIKIVEDAIETAKST